MNPWNVIQKLESDNSRIFKEGVLSTLLQTDPDTEFWAGSKLAYDPMVTFGVRKVPVKAGSDGPGLAWDAFFDKAIELADRRATGQAALDLIDALMEQATVEQWNDWYRRILIKDFRCNTTDSTINKVRPGTVPLFTCQLAKDANDNASKMTGKKLLDYKLDGVRVLAIVRPANGIATLYSRSGKEFANFPHIQKQLLLSTLPPDKDWVLDGEITSTSFQELMTQVHRKSNAKADDAVLNLFDAIPLEDFLKGEYKAKQRDRSATLKKMHENHFKHLDNIKVLDFVEVDIDTQEGMDTLNTMRDTAAKLGLEGIMVKDATAPYKCKRTTAWLKIKPTITVDLKITGAEEGTGKYQGMLGAFQMEGVDQGRKIEVSVGSGLTDDMRADFWNNLKKLIGMIAEVKADAVTQNQDGTYSLRFPRFQRFRGFEPGEKL